MIEVAVVLAAFLACLLLGAPVALAMALGVAAYAVAFGMPPVVVAQTLMQGLDGTAFMAIPYFFLAGAIMNAGGMSARLLRLARACLGHLRGGLAHANVGASVVFAGVSGSAVADAAAVGSVMIPAMRRDGYGGAYAAAVTAASATIGLVIPPSVPLVIYGLFTGADIGALFLAGLVPGLLMGAFLLVVTLAVARRRDHPRAPFAGWGEVARALRAGALALLMPVLVVGALVGGIATTAEIGAIAAAYAALVTLLLGEAGPRVLWTACREAAADAAKVLIVVALSGAFVWIVAAEGAAREAAAVLGASGLPPVALLAGTAVALLALGTVLEPVTLLVVIVPPLAAAVVPLGVDAVQLGVVAVLSAAIGLVTPPVGLLLFMTAAQADAPVPRVVAEAAPFLAALAALLAAVVAVPGLTLWLPGLLR